MNERTGICATCRFWQLYGSNPHSGLFGDCHRNPPQCFSDERLEPCDDGRWPTTWHNDWCGEWQPIHKETA